MTYRKDAVLVRSDALRPGDVDRLNGMLDAAGLGRPLGEPGDSGYEFVTVPVTGDADPAQVRDAVRAARGRGEQVPDVDLDMTYALDVAQGDKLGHGAGWLPVQPGTLPPGPPWRQAGGEPVLAVLDTGVRLHSWLPLPFHGEPFCAGLGLDEIGWRPAVELRTDAPDTRELASHRGHATFIAGLIRRMAPRVQVLSVRVMGDDGVASERNVISALNWLAHEYQGRLDVVLMALGRHLPENPGEMGEVEELRLAIDDLAATRHVPIVASAGNDGSDRRTVPACFADDPGSPVVSVGAGYSADDPAWFSNRGSWVKQWRPGSDLLSILPMRPKSDPTWGSAIECFGDKFADLLPADEQSGEAHWSGTSFAAASYAAELAERAAGLPGVAHPTAAHSVGVAGPAQP